jgi:hypothetical protein
MRFDIEFHLHVHRCREILPPNSRQHRIFKAVVAVDADVEEDHVGMFSLWLVLEINGTKKTVARRSVGAEDGEDECKTYPVQCIFGIAFLDETMESSGKLRKRNERDWHASVGSIP